MLFDVCLDHPHDRGDQTDAPRSGATNHLGSDIQTNKQHRETRSRVVVRGRGEGSWSQRQAHVKLARKEMLKIIRVGKSTSLIFDIARKLFCQATVELDSVFAGHRHYTPFGDMALLFGLSLTPQVVK